MAEYRLSERAEGDLARIYEYSAKNHGIYQADAYGAGLIHSFELLADFPLMGVNVDEVIVGLQSFRFQSHTIYYTVETGTIMIRAISHIRQKLRSSLFE